MPILQWLELAGWLLVGMIPFVALGLFIGYLAVRNLPGERHVRAKRAAIAGRRCPRGCSPLAATAACDGSR